MAIYQTATERIQSRAKARREAYGDALRRAETDPKYAAAEREFRALTPLAAKGEKLSEYAAAKSRLDALRKSLRLSLPDPDCPLCGDTGFDGSGRPCRCLRQEINRLIEESVLGGLPDEFFSEARDDLFGEEKRGFFRKVYAEAKSLAENPQNFSQCVFVYCGKTGTGKSHLAKCLATELKAKGGTALLFPAYPFFDLLSGLYKNEDKRVILSALADSDLLVVDDLGCEACGEYARNVFLSVLSARMEKKKLTVFTTNLMPKDLQTVYGERVLSRLFDKSKSKVYLFDGKDARLSAK